MESVFLCVLCNLCVRTGVSACVRMCICVRQASVWRQGWEGDFREEEIDRRRVVHSFVRSSIPSFVPVLCTHHVTIHTRTQGHTHKHTPAEKEREREI